MPQRTSPDSAGIFLSMVFRKVVLPDPFGPMIPRHSPRRRINEMSRASTLSRITDGGFFNHQHVIPGPLDRLQTKITRRLICADSFYAIELRQHRASRFRLLRFLSGQIATNKLLRLGDQLLLVIVSTLLCFTSLFALDQIIGIVTGVARSATVLQLDNATTRAIEKVTIVADDHVSRGIALQKLFEPFDRCDIEMIGRFIEQKHIGFGEQQAHQTEPVLLAT